MWKYLVKLEVRTAWVYYLFMFFFVFLWGIFLFTGAFSFKFLEKVKDQYKKGVCVSVLFYPRRSSQVKELTSKIKNLDLVKSLELITPQEIYEKTSRYIPRSLLKIFGKKRLVRSFPYLINIYPKNSEDYTSLVKTLSLLQTNQSFQVITNQSYKLVGFIKKLQWGAIGLIGACILFYVWFLSFLIYILKLKLKSQYQVFILLGGSKGVLKVIRTFVCSITSALGFVLGAILTSWIFAKIAYFLPLGLSIAFADLLKTSLLLGAFCETLLILLVGWKG